MTRSGSDRVPCVRTIAAAALETISNITMTNLLMR
jgi:hypothetical protein